MTDPRESPRYDLKQCARCQAWIPQSATKCAYCDTAQVDTPAPRGARTPLRVRGFSITKYLIWANVVYMLWSLYIEAQITPADNALQWLFRPPGKALRWAGWYTHDRTFGGEWWRVVTACFLHGGLLHIALNMYALHQLGRICEEIFGWVRYLAIYLVCGACSTLAVSVWYIGILEQEGHVPVVGASGAIFGIAGLLMAFLFRRGTAHGKRLASALAKNLGIILLIGLIGWIPISNTAHVGGLLPGLLFGLIVGERFTDEVNPYGRKVWELVAAITVAVTVLALGQGVLFVVKHLIGG